MKELEGMIRVILIIPSIYAFYLSVQEDVEQAIYSFSEVQSNTMFGHYVRSLVFEKEVGGDDFPPFENSTYRRCFAIHVNNEVEDLK